MATQYMSGQQALDKGLISEAELQAALKHPWSWVELDSGIRIREIPWQGLEIEYPEELTDRAYMTGVAAAYLSDDGFRAQLSQLAWDAR